MSIPRALRRPTLTWQPDSGTPTSTTTSLSALSTTAIKDGHRGHPNGAHHRGHQHNLSTNSLEAERADRISRLTGFGVSTLRGAPPFPHTSTVPSYNTHGLQQQHLSQSQQQPLQFPSQTTPTFPAAAFPALGNPTPAYFDAAGQPVAATKMSTVGSASATESVTGRSNVGLTETGDEDDDEVTRHDPDSDTRSMGTRSRGNDTEIEMDSASGYMMEEGHEDAIMDDDNDMLATRSAGGFDMDQDRMSDDGSASLVGFGEGAGSTVSGPIYHRRPVPAAQAGSSASAMAGAGVWGLERSGSGLSETQRRETPVSQSAMQERLSALLVDGVAVDGASATVLTSGEDDVFVDTTTRGPVPVVQLQQPLSAIRETQQPHSHQQQQHQARQGQQAAPPLPSPLSTTRTSREAERIIRERLEHGESRVGADNSVLGSPKGGQRLGRFYFEERK